MPCRGLPTRLFSHHIITEGNIERRQRFAAPGLRQVVHHDFKTLHIELQKVEVHVQAVVAIVDFADRQLKERPLVGRQNAIAKFMPPFFQRYALFCRGKRAQIITGDAIFRRCRQDSLLPVGIHHHAQHIVTGNELVPGFLQHGEIELIVAFIPLKQDVAGNATIANEMCAPQPVGVLNGCQREGHITLTGVVPQYFRLRSARRRLGLTADKLREAMRRQILPCPFRIDAYAQVVLNITTEFKEEQRVHAKLQQILVREQ
ncbi:Uncharacterised protein [Raoultella ornithinolytica]|nr:Uncharacterised protein [Raoultella ornithinolytica]